MDELTQRHQVELAMIYLEPGWFTKVPENWQLVGELKLNKEFGVIARSAVNFFATSPRAVAGIGEALKSFQQTLPPSVNSIFSEAANAEISP